MSLLDLFRRPVFGDYDYAPEDEWLDHAFRADENTGGIHGLVGAVPGAGRIPWPKILAGAPAANVPVKWVPGYETRGAPVMDPIAQMIHWDASNPSPTRPDPALGICTNGRAAGKGVTAVPGPLCNAYVGLTAIHVVASGRANHPGKGWTPLLDQIRRGQPYRDRNKPSMGGAGGAFIGYEVAGNGKQRFTPEQERMLRFLTGAVAGHYHWGPERTIDHMCWAADRKIDVQSVYGSLGAMRKALHR